MEISSYNGGYIVPLSFTSTFSPFLFSSRDSESWYCFECVCLSVCLPLSAPPCVCMCVRVSNVLGCS